MQGRKGEWEDGEQSAPKCHQNQNHDGEMTFFGHPEGAFRQSSLLAHLSTDGTKGGHV